MNAEAYAYYVAKNTKGTEAQLELMARHLREMADKIDALKARSKDHGPAESQLRANADALASAAHEVTSNLLPNMRIDICFNLVAEANKLLAPEVED